MSDWSSDVCSSDLRQADLRAGRGHADRRRAGAMTIALADVVASEALGARLAGLVRAGDVVTLSGPVGAGKTSIARGLLAALGIEGEAPQPSFAIVTPSDPRSEERREGKECLGPGSGRGD